MPIRPTGFRVLVKPDAQPTETESGLHLLTSRHHVPVSGTVVAIGCGSEHVHRERCDALKQAIKIVEGLSATFQYPAALRMACEDLARLLVSQKPETSEVNVWDRVLFPAEAGSRITEDGEEFILLNEDDIYGRVTEAEESEAVA